MSREQQPRHELCRPRIVALHKQAPMRLPAPEDVIACCGRLRERFAPP
jgi:hypothetical protein